MLKHAGWRQAGISLVELMVGLTVGLLVIAAATSIYIVVVRSGSEILASAKLNEELRAVMNLMIADIRRAGSWTASADLASKTPSCVDDANPFTVRGTICPHQTDLQILDSGSAIQLTYNRLTDWEYGVLIGFRLNGGAIQTVQCNNNATTPVACDTASLATGWEGLSDINTVTVDSLSFSAAGSRCLNSTTNVSLNSLCPTTNPVNQRLIEKRQILITLTGHLTTRPEYIMTLRQAVWVANDRVIGG
ncbi:MAG: prepilin-type N-terminal cleavage/methylation domain-containing protein [Chromatiaceae bacterium]|nr:prepilin-type N-terminal cleavage/methylation domain-containing protein [Chromatiaceae bacterium]